MGMGLHHAPPNSDQRLDLTNCDREPIHIPGSIQPHGFLLACTATDPFRVAVASQNATDYLPGSLESLLGAPASEILGRRLAHVLQAELESGAPTGTLARRISTAELVAGDGESHKFDVIFHRVDDLALLEFEMTDESTSHIELNASLATFASSLEDIRDRDTLFQASTEQVRKLTGYDRVLLYQFDEEGHGNVLAESRNDRLPSYIGLRFPESDIPKQARALYLQNRTRIIPDVNYEPSALVAADSFADAPPLDLSQSVLRSVSPVHREYMRNMGIQSSMSISIVSRGKLWGLISGHNATPRSVPYPLRTACDLLSRVLAAQVIAVENENAMADTVRLRSVQVRLLASMAGREHYLEGLAEQTEALLAIAGATGAAVLLEDQCMLLGKTPSRDEVLELASWLSGQPLDEIYATRHLVAVYAPGEQIRETASGVLSLQISQVHRLQLIWFRPEVVQTVQWAGEYAKEQDVAAANNKLSPRRSFESWKEVVHGRSSQWKPAEVDSVREFRTALLEIVLKRAEEIADLVAEVKLANAELEAFSYSVSHDLRAPFRHISGFAEILIANEASRLTETGQRHLGTIAKSAQFAGSLVDSLLNFSRIARTRLELTQSCMDPMIRSVWSDVLREEGGGRAFDFAAALTPEVCIDMSLMKQVWRNLFSNAVKYTRKQEAPRVRVESKQEEGEYIFCVQDNGVGFDAKYAHKLFGAFQRLHRMEDFEGTGVGLANIRRIIARHGGHTWATGKEGEGASFFFTLPIPRS